MEEWTAQERSPQEAAASTQPGHIWHDILMDSFSLHSITPQAVLQAVTEWEQQREEAVADGCFRRASPPGETLGAALEQGLPTFSAEPFERQVQLYMGAHDRARAAAQGPLQLPIPANAPQGAEWPALCQRWSRTRGGQGLLQLHRLHVPREARSMRCTWTLGGALSRCTCADAHYDGMRGRTNTRPEHPDGRFVLKTELGMQLFRADTGQVVYPFPAYKQVRACCCCPSGRAHAPRLTLRPHLPSPLVLSQVEVLCDHLKFWLESKLDLPESPASSLRVPSSRPC